MKKTTSKNSLAARMALVLAAFLIMVASSSAVMYYTLSEKLLRNAEATMDETQTLLSRILLEPETALNLIANNIEGIYNRGAGIDVIKAYIDEASSEKFKEQIIADYYSVYAYFDVIGEFHDGLGWVPGEGYEPRGRPWYLAAPASGEVGLSEPYIDMNTSHRVIAYSRRLFDESGGLIGVVGIDVLLDEFRDMVINKRITPNSYGYMIDETYRVIMHQNTDREGQFFWESGSATYTFADLISKGHDISFGRSTNYAGTPSVVFGRQIYNNWYFVLIIPEHEYYAELYSMILITGLLGAALASILIAMLIQMEKAKRKADDERMEKSARLAEIEKAREADERIRLMFDKAPLCIIYWDAALNVVDCNQEGVKLFGLGGKQELLEHWYELSPGYQPDGRRSADVVREVTEETFEKGWTRFEWMHQKLSGEQIPCEVTLAAVKFRDETGMLGYVRDLRELKRIMGELQEALKDAEIANKTKTAFLAQMSHEIRTPMNAILGISEILLQNEALTPDVLESLEKIYSSGDLLLGIINDILDLSKVEAGKLEIIVEKYSISSLVSDTTQVNMMRIGSKLIEFELQIDEDMPEFLSGDELRVKQILNNLLSNAVKYTHEGTVVLSVSTEEIENNSDEVILVLSVRDTGQGMTKEQIKKLFDDYTRFNMRANRATEGTGLGMSIVQKLVQLMNGEITVESEPEKGSVFTVRIPQGRPESPGLGREMVENLKHFRSSSRAQMKRVQITREPMPYGKILIVDDVETNIFVAKGLMAPYKLDIDEADGGFAAIDKIKSGKVYDIIFMDHMMPDMDGVETTRIIRAMGYDRPVVALSADAVAGKAEFFRKNGFDDFVSKPIDIRQLNNVLNKLVRDKQQPEVLEAARRETGGAEEKSRAPSLIGGREVDGIDVARGLERYGGDEEIYLKILRSYAASIRQMLGEIETVDETDLNKYRIKVHGIKGASFDVFASKIGEDAKALEHAALAHDLDYLNENHLPFRKDLGRFLDRLDAFLGETDAGNPKPEKDKPDGAVLEKLRAACETYDIDEVDAAMDEIGKYRYGSDGGLAEWLQDKVHTMSFSEIVQKLS